MNTPVIVEEIFDAPVAKIWRALTDKSEMKKWYFDLDEFSPTVGFVFKFAGKGHKGESYMHICTVTEVVPEKKLQYSWEYEQVNGRSFVTFELTSENSKTKLRLTHEGLETFPQNNPDFAKESFTGGWTSLIKQSLNDYIKSL